jgi:hypothetical protein
LESHEPDLVVWSSLFVKRPDAIVRFDLPPGGEGTDLRWSLSVVGPVPDDPLINANMRYTFGQ